MPKTDILFIHPGNQKRIYQDLSKEYTAVATPAWTLLLANYVRDNGYSVSIYDVNVEGWDERVPSELLSKYNPELVSIMVYGHNPSASTQTMSAAGKIAKDIKSYNKEIPIAMGGIHPSALPAKTLLDERIDFVVKGEGVYSLKELIGYLKGERKLSEVRGVWFKKGDKIESTFPAPIILDLDSEIGGYAWDLLPDLANYRAHNMHCFQNFEKSIKDDFSDVRTPYVAMNTSLGCPYSCSYCCINAIFGKPKIRYWSLERVMTWFDEIALKYHVKNIRLDDELFILSPERVEKFCDMLIERNYNLNLWVYGRVDTIRGNLLKKMKKSGINWLCLGIESGNENVRRNVHKNIRTDIRKTVEQIQSNGIYVLGNYMFGLPEDDLNTMEETLKLAKDLNCEFANFYTVMAFPGSELYKTTLEKGVALSDNWNSYSQHSIETSPLPTKYLTGAEVLSFRDNAFHNYFRDSKYLNMIDSKFGGRTRVHLEKMLNISLKREILKGK